MCTLVAPPIRRRQWLGLATAAVVVGAAGLAGCHQQPPLRLGSIVFTGYEPVFMARELGWLDPALVRLVELYSNTDALRALAAGQIEAAQLTVDEFLSGRAEGLDLRIIAVLDESLGADVVIAHPQLHDRQDIRGRRIAVEDGAVGAVMLSAFLKARGLLPSDVVSIPVALGHNLELFRQGSADLFVTAEPWASRLEHLGGIRLFDSAAIPERIVDVMVARADTLEPWADGLHAAVAAHFRAVALLKNEPERAAALMSKRLQLPPDEVMASLKGLVQPNASESLKLLDPDGPLLRNIQDLQQLMVNEGLLPRLSPPASLFDPRFHPSPT